MTAPGNEVLQGRAPRNSGLDIGCLHLSGIRCGQGPCGGAEWNTIGRDVTGSGGNLMGRSKKPNTHQQS